MAGGICVAPWYPLIVCIVDVAAERLAVPHRTLIVGSKREEVKMKMGRIAKKDICICTSGGARNPRQVSWLKRDTAKSGIR
jgi:hypothetical protein